MGNLFVIFKSKHALFHLLKNEELHFYFFLDLFAPYSRRFVKGTLMKSETLKVDKDSNLKKVSGDSPMKPLLSDSNLKNL